MRHHYTFTEASQELHVEHEFVVRCVRSHWIRPANPAGPQLDDQDLARIRLIHSLLTEMGVNDESVPIILHLIDQLLSLQAQLRRASRAA